MQSPADPRPGALRPKAPRLAVRGLIMHNDRLLVVNAWPAGRTELWCAPGGGVNPGTSLPDNLMREVYEETGLRVTVSDPALVNEFHDPDTGFHQVDIYFRCTITDGLRGDAADPAWTGPEGIVTERRFVTRAELAHLRHKPDSLGDAAWGQGILYDALEIIVK